MSCSQIPQAPVSACADRSRVKGYDMSRVKEKGTGLACGMGPSVTNRGDPPRTGHLYWSKAHLFKIRIKCCSTESSNEPQLMLSKENLSEDFFIWVVDASGFQLCWADM